MQEKNELTFTVAIYYVVAEALTNIAKHARASQAVVEVDETDGIIRVSVSDDGVGGADLSRGQDFSACEIGWMHSAARCR
jgi:signal transduction histidine kinase